jgi:hypothetical protein
LTIKKKLQEHFIRNTKNKKIDEIGEVSDLKKAYIQRKNIEKQIKEQSPNPKRVSLMDKYLSDMKMIGERSSS